MRLLHRRGHAVRNHRPDAFDFRLSSFQFVTTQYRLNIMSTIIVVDKFFTGNAHMVPDIGLKTLSLYRLSDVSISVGYRIAPERSSEFKFFLHPWASVRPLLPTIGLPANYSCHLSAFCIRPIVVTLDTKHERVNPVSGE
ncbi:hypothetical protein [Arthrobacter pigmenti]